MSAVFAQIFGSSPGVFLGVTLCFMGGCTFLSGQAVAAAWRPAWQMVPYGLLLGLGDRFLIYALFNGRLLALAGYLLDAALLVAIGLLAHRLTRMRQLARQYPWLYRRTGPLSCRALQPDAEP